MLLGLICKAEECEEDQSANNGSPASKLQGGVHDWVRLPDYGRVLIHTPEHLKCTELSTKSGVMRTKYRTSVNVVPIQGNNVSVCRIDDNYSDGERYAE